MKKKTNDEIPFLNIAILIKNELEGELIAAILNAFSYKKSDDFKWTIKDIKDSKYINIENNKFYCDSEMFINECKIKNKKLRIITTIEFLNKYPIKKMLNKYYSNI